MAKQTMMDQYDTAKESVGDALLLFRMGDFYELFRDDAKVAARQLGLALTSRDKKTNPIPMAGFPYHQLDGYLGKLVQSGFRVAVCEQVQDPREATGLVQREVTRIVTPGTVTDDSLLEPKESNYLMAVISLKGPPRTKTSLIASVDDQPVGIAWADLSTGTFYASVIRRGQLVDQIARIAPAECLVGEDDDTIPEFLNDQFMLTRRPAWAFNYDTAESTLTKQFGTKSLDGFGFADDDEAAIRAAGSLLEYLLETQKASLDHIHQLIRYRSSNTLEIDEATWRSLEITRTIRDGRREGSLLGVMDQTVTSMGGRLLADWLSNPLTDVAAIADRQDAVAEFAADGTMRDNIREQLKQIFDVERLLSRVATGRCSPRDLSYIGKTLKQIPSVTEQLGHPISVELADLAENIDPQSELCALLEAAIVDDCPLHLKDGGIIRTGYSEELDRMRELANGGKQWIAEYQATQADRIDVAGLKVGYNKVFGYYIEVTNAHKDKVPEDFIRKQTLKNAERYITPELKEYEEKVLSADQQANDLEYELFTFLRDQISAAQNAIRHTAQQLAKLDVLCSLAELANRRSYCRPEVVEEPALEIIEGRHPVLDVLEPEGTFIPNDTIADPNDKNILLITGPNMAGKSTYIRQVALLTLMAQVGSFLPAKSARIGIADRIFARVGASDELSRGQSTFMVEMTETARILNTSTKRSLIILDEIGRGTSTYDGVSLAWAIVEFIHEKLGSRTLFATHYHELTELESSLERLVNLNVSVREWEDNVVFLHKIVEGSADKSYGIHVAKLAGVPRKVNERAAEILAHLESTHTDTTSKTPANSLDASVQLSLFGYEEHPLIEELRGLDPENLTPMQALEVLAEIKRRLSESDE